MSKRKKMRKKLRRKEKKPKPKDEKMSCQPKTWHRWLLLPELTHKNKRTRLILH